MEGDRGKYVQQQQHAMLCSMPRYVVLCAVLICVVLLCRCRYRCVVWCGVVWLGDVVCYAARCCTMHYR